MLVIFNTVKQSTLYLTLVSLNALTFQVSMHVQNTINDYVLRHQIYKCCLHSCKIPVPLRKKNNYSKLQRTNFVPISAHSLISAPTSDEFLLISAPTLISASIA